MWLWHLHSPSVAWTSQHIAGACHKLTDDRDTVCQLNLCWPSEKAPARGTAIGPDLRKCTVPPENSPREGKLLYGLFAYCATFCQMFAAHRPCVPSVCTKEPRTVAAGQGENWACSSISSCSSLLSWRPLKTFAMLRAWSGCPQQLALSKREADLQRCTQASASSSLAANLFKRYSWQNLDGACLMPSHPHVLLLEQLGTYLFTHWVLKKTTLENTFSQGDQHWVSALSLRFLPPQPPSSLSESREQGQCMELLLWELTDNFPYL